MSEKTVIDGIDENEDMPPVDEPKKKKSSGKRKSKKKNRDEITEPETRSGFFYLFKLLATIFRSNTIFAEEEFKELAKAYVNLCNRFPILKFLIIWMAPLSALGELIEKFRKLREGMPKKPKKDRSMSVPVGVVQNGAGTGTEGGGTFTP